ncbi:MFS transporter [Rhodococcus artemisiae]
MTGLVLFLYVVNYADKAVLGIIAKPLSEELGLTKAEIGMIGSLFFVTFTIGGFFAGALNKYLTLRWGLALLAVIWSLTMLPMVISGTLAVLVASRMVLGLFEGPVTSLMHTAAYSWHPLAKRGLPSALLTGAGSLSKILLAPVLTWITIEFGWRAALLSLAGLGVVWVVCWLIGWQEGPFTRTATTADSPVESGQATTWTEPSVPWRTILLNRTFLSCALMTGVVYALTAVVLTWLPTYFEEGLNFSTLQAGSLFAAPSVVGLILMLTAGYTTDRLALRGVSTRIIRVIVPVAGVVLCGVTLISLPSIKAPIVAVVVLSLGYGLGAIALPLISTAISSLCPPQQTAGTMGTFMALVAVGGLIAPYATGVIVDNAASAAEGYSQAFQGVGFLCVATAIVVLLLANPERDGQRIRSGAGTATIVRSE